VIPRSGAPLSCPLHYVPHLSAWSHAGGGGDAFLLDPFLKINAIEAMSGRVDFGQDHH
jgi:hypothetical protein